MQVDLLLLVGADLDGQGVVLAYRELVGRHPVALHLEIEGQVLVLTAALVLNTR
jgi:hypothetical protein